MVPPQSHQGGVLQSMLDNPLAFGPPVTKSALSSTIGTREVKPGPPSPPRRQAHPNQAHAGPSTLRLNGEVHESKINLKTGEPDPRTVMSTPTRKGKELASPSQTTPVKEKGLYTADIDLTWPSHMINLKRPAAGLYNPSMACYANATLQVLLHTPPVLRIAQNHDEDTCKLPV